MTRVARRGPLKIFHLIKGLGRGGAEMLLTDGPATSDPSRFSYAFGYFVPYKNALVPELEARFGEVRCFDALGGAGMIAQVGRVARHVRALGIDIIHCHMPLASVVGRVAGAMVRVPVVSTEHNLLERYHPATRLATLATWRLQDRVIAVSSEVRSSIERHAGQRVPVDVVLNGVSAERFRRDAPAGRDVRDRLGIGREAPVVGTVAVFRVQKRLDLWLEAARRLLADVPAAHFLVVGDGPLRKEVEDGVRRLGLSDRVHLPGLQEEIRPFLSAMDVFFVASDFEGLPVALLEAMAMEVVPVVTDAGGMPEVVTSGTGLVVPRGDTSRMAGALREVLSLSREDRGQMGARARARVAEHFGTRSMMERIETIYEEVAVGRR